jgi:hypothetical protein
VNDPAGADIQMAYFRISHDLIGQTYSVSECQQLRTGVLFPDFIQEGRFSLCDGIPLPVFPNTPSIQNEQHAAIVMFHHAAFHEIVT